jgi:O-antigen/teichoic acid export membrane protein
MLDRTIIKNISSLFSIRIAGYIIPLITLPYLVRVLEPIGYGLLGFSLAIIQYFIIAVDFGFDLSATQKIAKNKNEKAKISIIFWNVIAVRVFISVIGLFIVILLPYLFVRLESVLPILLCGYLSVFGAALFPQWLFQGKEQLGTVSIIRIILQVISIPFLFIFVNDFDDVWVAALISAIPSLIIVIFSSYLIYERKWINWQAPSIISIKEEMADGWHLFLSTAAASLYTTSTTVILGIIAGPVSVAIYVSANKLLKAALAIYSPISASFYPRINNLMSKSKDEALVMIRYLMKVQTVLTFCTSICLYVFAPFVIDILFGQEYEKSITVLRVMSVLPIIIGFSNIFGIQVLLTYGFKKEFSRVLMSSGLFSIITLVPLCYFFDSIGAAVSVVITETIVTLLMFYIIYKNKIPLFKVLN